MGFDFPGIPFFFFIHKGRVMVIYAMTVGHFQKEHEDRAGGDLAPYLQYGITQ